MHTTETIRVEAFDIPRTSSLVARPSRRDAPKKESKKETQKPEPSGTRAPIATPPGHDDTNAEAVRAYRNWADVEFYPRVIAKMREKYPVTIQAREIAGVYTDIISPEAGVASANQTRILINLHAGGFTFGARLCGQLESIPIAATAGIDVISVSNIIGSWPPSTSASAAALPLYGTWVSLMPVIAARNSPAR